MIRAVTFCIGANMLQKFQVNGKQYACAFPAERTLLDVQGEIDNGTYNIAFSDGTVVSAEELQVNQDETITLVVKPCDVPEDMQASLSGTLSRFTRMNPPNTKEHAGLGMLYFPRAGEAFEPRWGDITNGAGYVFTYIPSQGAAA